MYINSYKIVSIKNGRKASAIQNVIGIDPVLFYEENVPTKADYGRIFVFKRLADAKGFNEKNRFQIWGAYSTKLRKQEQMVPWYEVSIENVQEFWKYIESGIENEVNITFTPFGTYTAETVTLLKRII